MPCIISKYFLFFNLQISSIAIATFKILSEEKREKVQNLSGVLVFNWYYTIRFIIFAKE